MVDKIVKVKGYRGVESGEIPSTQEAIRQASLLVRRSPVGNLQAIRESNRVDPHNCQRRYVTTNNPVGDRVEAQDNVGNQVSRQLATRGSMQQGDPLESSPCIDWGIGRPPGLPQSIPPINPLSTPETPKPGRADLKILACEREASGGARPYTWHIYSSHEDHLEEIPGIKSFMGDSGASDSSGIWLSSNLRNVGLK